MLDAELFVVHDISPVVVASDQLVLVLDAGSVVKIHGITSVLLVVSRIQRYIPGDIE
ncbi:MAG: hypothetical protein GYA24_02915 [Candidatus Lokiarchaeota archaeon]|nr:hypothetical protein [Candidatus Lokiarchaeota archaeon]